ncbi:MAG: ATP-binding cassette domain-containing protein, partial [Desulfatiglandales bacterium]
MKRTQLLTLNQVSKNFGGLTAVNRVSMAVSQGHICGLIGPNGAGKTTLFNVVTGVYPCSSGSIFLQDVDLTTLKP